VFSIIKEETCEYDIDKLYSLILEITDIHRAYYLKRGPDFIPINLKNTEVRHIIEQVDDSNTCIIKKEFHTILNSYLSNIDELTIDLDLEYTYKDLDLRFRVKQSESIIYKLIHYFSGKQEKGKIPLNKCLNDLLGFRVIMPGFDHDCEKFAKMCCIIKESYKIRYINSSKGDYRATHVYFYGESNKNFPWELQIWLPEDYQRNEKSHSLHKQEYKKSAQIHKKTLEY
jgi:Region found in RelA / SpoT proteins